MYPLTTFVFFIWLQSRCQNTCDNNSFKKYQNLGKSVAWMIVMLFSKMTRCIKRAQCLNICIQENEHKKRESISPHEYRFKEIRNRRDRSKEGFFVFYEQNITPKCVRKKIWLNYEEKELHYIGSLVEWVALSHFSECDPKHTTFAFGQSGRLCSCRYLIVS